jgi:DNA-directed RNA polymerase specialized sigma24 family protein
MQPLRLEALSTALPNVGGPTLEEEAQKHDDEQRLKQAIARLSAQDQDMLALRYAAALPEREIAAVQDCCLPCCARYASNSAAVRTPCSSTAS